MNTDVLFFSLDEARSEIRRRWADIELREKVAKNLGDNLMAMCGTEPIAFYWTGLLAPDHAFDFVESAANYIGCKPVCPNYLEDKFVSGNEEKKCLMRIRVVDEHGEHKSFDLGSLRSEFGKKLKDVKIHNGTSLVDFYRNLFEIFHPGLDIEDISDWFLKHKPAATYYKILMEHFICFGVFFVSVDGENDSEDYFTHKVMIPAIKETELKYGLKPIIVRPFPKDQTTKEDFYWFSYNRSINNFLLKYARSNNLTLQDL